MSRVMIFWFNTSSIETPMVFAGWALEVQPATATETKIATITKSLVFMRITLYAAISGIRLLEHYSLLHFRFRYWIDLRAGKLYPPSISMPSGNCSSRQPQNVLSRWWVRHKHFRLLRSRNMPPSGASSWPLAPTGSIPVWRNSCLCSSKTVFRQAVRIVLATPEPPHDQPHPRRRQSASPHRPTHPTAGHTAVRGRAAIDPLRDGCGAAADGPLLGRQPRIPHV